MKHDFGLIDSDISNIHRIIKQFDNIDKVVIFGSRAKGNHKPGSDVDLALIGDQIDLETTLKMSYILNEETTMPYHFDVLALHTVQEPALIEHIQRAGIEIYHR
jgi:predicted nucleotidyltransferase